MNVENSGLKHHVMCRELQIFYRPGGKNGCRKASVRMELSKGPRWSSEALGTSEGFKWRTARRRLL